MKAIPDEYVSWIRLCGPIISLAVAVSFVASFFYGWGFYLAFDLSYARVPTSLGDYLRDALNFLEFASAMAIGAILGRVLYVGEFLGLDDTNFKWNKTNINIARKIIDIIKQTSKSYQNFIRAVFVVPPFQLVFIYFVPSYASNLSKTAVTQIVVSIVAFCMLSSSPQESVRKFSLIYFPLIMLGFYLYGQGDAEEYIDGNSQIQLVHTIEPSVDSGRQILHAYALKYLERGILVCEVRNRKNGSRMDCQNNVVFLPWEKVVKVRMRGKGNAS